MFEKHKVVTAISLISFPIWIFTVFDFTFAECYIDDGCGKIDPWVPIIVLTTSIFASLFSGWLVAFLVRAFTRRA